jgi:hypothetical protein
MGASTAAVDGEVAHSPKRGVLWAGRILTALPVLLMVMSGVMKIARQPAVIDNMTGKFGYPASTAVGIGLVEIASIVLYAIPRTAVLGAILVTGYLGGAVATHVRVGDPSFITPALLGVIAWAGLFLRDERLRALLPLRR